MIFISGQPQTTPIHAIIVEHLLTITHGISYWWCEGRHHINDGTFFNCFFIAILKEIITGFRIFDYVMITLSSTSAIIHMHEIVNDFRYKLF